jgi:hypothetical protein
MAAGIHSWFLYRFFLVQEHFKNKKIIPENAFTGIIYLRSDSESARYLVRQKIQLMNF